MHKVFIRKTIVQIKLPAGRKKCHGEFSKTAGQLSKCSLAGRLEKTIVQNKTACRQIINCRQFLSNPGCQGSFDSFPPCLPILKMQAGRQTSCETLLFKIKLPAGRTNVTGSFPILPANYQNSAWQAGCL